MIGLQNNEQSEGARKYGFALNYVITVMDEDTRINYFDTPNVTDIIRMKAPSQIINAAEEHKHNNTVEVGEVWKGKVTSIRVMVLQLIDDTYLSYIYLTDCGVLKCEITNKVELLRSFEKAVRPKVEKISDIVEALNKDARDVDEL